MKCTRPRPSSSTQSRGGEGETNHHTHQHHSTGAHHEPRQPHNQDSSLLPQAVVIEEGVVPGGGRAQGLLGEQRVLWRRLPLPHPQAAQTTCIIDQTPSSAGIMGVSCEGELRGW